LVAWKFISGPLNYKDLGSQLKAVDLHINDISVTEKEGAAALVRTPLALYQDAPSLDSTKLPVCPCQTSCFSKRQMLAPRNTPDLWDEGKKHASVGLSLVLFVSTNLLPFSSSQTKLQLLSEKRSWVRKSKVEIKLEIPRPKRI
jgi:hypothetical protein